LKIGISLQAKMTTQSPEQIAAAYMSNYESLWNSDRAASVAKLYAPDSLLIGYAIAVGQGEIEKLLETLFAQGWTRISIKVVKAREVGGVVLVANEYSAHGSGPNAGKTLSGKSSYVLTHIDGAWLAAMHTAT
jgi:ketosteroid isomerase-like protein